jgi:hypothetical protein
VSIFRPGVSCQNKRHGEAGEFGVEFALVFVIEGRDVSGSWPLSSYGGLFVVNRDGRGGVDKE